MSEVQEEVAHEDLYTQHLAFNAQMLAGKSYNLPVMSRVEFEDWFSQLDGPIRTNLALDYSRGYDATIAANEAEITEALKKYE